MVRRIAFIMSSLWIAGIGLLALNAFAGMPDKYIVPSFVILTLTITIYGFYVSYLQWAKNRLETELLKEQFRLLVKFLDDIQRNLNCGFILVENNGKVLKGSPSYFSALSHKSLLEINPDLFVVIHFPLENGSQGIFSETKSDCLNNPLFPAAIVHAISPLRFDSFFIKSDYAKSWFHDEKVRPQEQFVLLVGAQNDALQKKPLRIAYGGGYLLVKDLINIYEKFDKELSGWFLDNNISNKLHPKHKYA